MALQTSDPEAVRSAARDILSQPQFENHDPSWWQELIHYVTHPTELLTLALDWIASRFVGTGTGTIVAWVVVAVVLLGVLAMAIYLTRSTSHDNVVPVGFGSGPTQRTAADFSAEADQYEQQGEWRQAIRMLYAAVLADAAAKGTLRLRPGRTTGEYLADAQLANPGWAHPFESVTRLFERAWYGDAASTAEDLGFFKQAASRLKGSKVA